MKKAFKLLSLFLVLSFIACKETSKKETTVTAEVKTTEK